MGEHAENRPYLGFCSPGPLAAMTSPPGNSGLPGYARELVNALEPLTIDDFDFRNRGVPGRNLGTISSVAHVFILYVSSRGDQSFLRVKHVHTYTQT